MFLLPMIEIQFKLAKANKRSVWLQSQGKMEVGLVFSSHKFRKSNCQKNLICILFILFPWGSASLCPTTGQFLLTGGRHDTDSSRVHFAFQHQWLGMIFHASASAICESPKGFSFSILGPQVYSYSYGVGGLRLFTLAELHSSE